MSVVKRRGGGQRSWFGKDLTQIKTQVLSPYKKPFDFPFPLLSTFLFAFMLCLKCPLYVAQIWEGYSPPVVYAMD